MFLLDNTEIESKWLKATGMVEKAEDKRRIMKI
jgi:hypothetical protein